jgi:hypothetical protein
MNLSFHHPWLALSALAFSLCQVTACEDPNKMFQGIWTTNDAYADLDAHFVGTPMLAIGHYGLEMTGLVYFRAGDGEFTSTCPCALIKGDIGGAVDFDDGRVSFTTSCLEAVDPETGAGVFSDASVSWELDLGDEPDPDERTLTGLVSRAGESVQVQFERSLRDVPSEQRMCPPEGWCDGDDCGASR